MIGRGNGNTQKVGRQGRPPKAEVGAVAEVATATAVAAGRERAVAAAAEGGAAAGGDATAHIMRALPPR